ncbi:MAG: hypothetical protein LPK09_00120, partial [Hymenobacteraceae bacterium]|nr:hypothetical protein [Hymenobacteraceae bacterium]
FFSAGLLPLESFSPEAAAKVRNFFPIPSNFISVFFAFFLELQVSPVLAPVPAERGCKGPKKNRRNKLEGTISLSKHLSASARGALFSKPPFRRSSKKDNRTEVVFSSYR